MPELATAATATYRWYFDNGATGFIRGEHVYESEYQIVENIPTSVATREVNTVNASAGMSLASGWDFTLWVRNLTDDEYLLSAFPVPAQAGSFNGYPTAPRTYGLSIRKIF